MGIYLSFSYLIICPFFILTGIYTSRIMIFSIHTFFHFSMIQKSLFWSCILFGGKKLTESIYHFKFRGVGWQAFVALECQVGRLCPWIIMCPVWHLLWRNASGAWLSLPICYEGYVWLLLLCHLIMAARPLQVFRPGFKGNFWLILMLLWGCGKLESYLKLSLHRWAPPKCGAEHKLRCFRL